MKVTEVDETIITCSVCGQNFDEGDVNIIDYDLDLCVKCEEEHKKEMGNSKMTNTKRVSITLASASFLVSGKNNEEYLENAKLAFAEQISQGKFPQITYGISDADALTLQTAHPGLIVESNTGKLGICTAVHKKNIDVTFQNHIQVTGSPKIFKASNATFEEVRSKRSESDKKIGFWTEGYTGFINTREGISEVVVGKLVRGKAKLHVINTTKYINLSITELEKFLKDEKNELI